MKGTEVYNEYEMESKTEVKKESPTSEFNLQNEENFCSFPVTKVENNTASYSAVNQEENKTEFKQVFIVDIGVHNEKSFPYSDVHMKESRNLHNDVDGVYTKIEIKEEPLLQERTPPEVQDEAKAEMNDDDFIVAEAPRLYTEAASTSTPCLFTTQGLKEKVNLTQRMEVENTKTCTLNGNGAVLCTDQGDLNRSHEDDKLSDADKMNTQKADLKTHSLVHKRRSSYKCDVCGKSFTQRGTLKEHMFIHEGKRPYKCDVCDKTFTQRSSLRVHIMMHQGLKPYKCETCGKCYANKESVKEHQTFIHEGKRPYQCEICLKNFTRKSYLKSHKFIHASEKPYKCNVCGKPFSHVKMLKVHSVIHEGKKSYKCHACDKIFCRRGTFRQHILIHEGGMPKQYPCEICHKNFTQRTDLTKHMLIHEGKRPYVCNFCDRSFTQRSHLKTHVWIHEGKRPYKCDICNKPFTRKEHVQRHVLVHACQKS